MPRLSILIPVLGETPSLDDTLISVLENRPVDCEILVVHNHPYDDPYHLGDEVRLVEAEAGAGLAGCLNRGLAEARSAVLHVLACGVEVTPGWTDEVLRHFDDPAVASVTPVVLDRGDPDRIVSVGWGYRVEGTVRRLGAGDRADQLSAYREDLCGPDRLAGFYRVSALRAVGGFSDRAGDALSAIDVALALQQAGFHGVLESQCVARTDPAMVRDGSAWRRGRDVERLFWYWASNQGWLVSLAGHLALLVGEGLLGFWRPSLPLRWLGRFWGWIEAMTTGRRHRRPKVTRGDLAAMVGRPHFALASRKARESVVRE
ncbi:MAG: glycosyltransferase family 2 protein [Thermoguttaceae bacterium]